MKKWFQYHVAQARPLGSNALVGPCYNHNGQRCKAEIIMNEVYNQTLAHMPLRVAMRDDRARSTRQ